jgi:5-oxoprolinase (ATP-hydrolysing)
VIRRIEFLKPLRVSILSERRGPYVPQGLNGGPPGSLGINSLSRASTGQTEILGGKVQLDVAPGDILTLQTPGGGGALPAG